MLFTRCELKAFNCFLISIAVLVLLAQPAFVPSRSGVAIGRHVFNHMVVWLSIPQTWVRSNKICIRFVVAACLGGGGSAKGECGEVGVHRESHATLNMESCIPYWCACLCCVAAREVERAA